MGSYRSILATLGGVNNYLNNLVGYWKFDSNSNDFSTNGHNGTNSNISFANGGIIGNSATFGTSISSVIVTDSDDFSFTNGTNDFPFTISFWFYHTNTPSANGYWYVNKRGLISADTPTQNEWQVVYFQGNFLFDLFTNNTNYIRALSAQTLSNSTWYQITATYNGNGNQSGLKLYLNGSLMTTTNSQTGTYTGTTNTPANVTFGRRGWISTVGFLNGRLDETYIWKNRELTASEVTDIYAKGLAGQTLI